MNRSSSKADAANGSVFRQRVRHLLAACICGRRSAGRSLTFSYLWDRMGFSCGQRQLRLIGRSCTQAMFSLVRRSRRPA
jgi:hypothetical protein